MDMRDEALPMHDYFIFVPVTREEKYPFSERRFNQDIRHPGELVNEQDLHMSWTRIALAETFDIYARL